MNLEKNLKLRVKIKISRHGTGASSVIYHVGIKLHQIAQGLLGRRLRVPDAIRYLGVIDLRDDSAHDCTHFKCTSESRCDTA